MTAYPGVFIDESTAPSLSVATAATAVPIFAAAETHTQFETVRRINSWLEFTTLEITADSMIYRCIRTYFENGGGYCYILHPSKFIQEIPKLDDVTLLVAAGENIQTAVETLCVAGQTLFAILDAPNLALSTIGTDFSAYGRSEYSALYYPWLHAEWAKAGASYLDIPPSAALAGVYCVVDRERGVWKAAANVALKGGLRPTFTVNDVEQNDHQPCNMLREFQGRGTVVWGARTLASFDANTPWRYVPIRRLVNSIEREIKHTLTCLVFEPNNTVTWQRACNAINNYLLKLWQQGALLGNTESEAYFVQADKDVTMTDEDIREGKLIVKVGLATTRPAEFMILELRQQIAQN